MAKPAKHPARSAPPGRSGGNLMLGIFIGLVIGLGIALGVAFYLSKAPLPFIDRTRTAETKDGKAAPGEPARLPAIAGMPQGGDKTDKPKFDFYKILPGGEEPVTEKELKDAAKSGGNPPEARGVYFIQAGSFQNPAEADNQKAKIAVLGFESNVEPTPLPDKGTWYRVRLGPYTTLEDINRVRRVLSQNGINADLVKLKDVTAKEEKNQ
jgi:cell division protein FtsN